MKRLVLVGAGHAHLATIHAIDRFRDQGIDVTVVDPSEDLWYSGMASARIGGRTADRGVRIPVADIVHRAGAEFLRGVVTRIVPDERRIIVGERSIPFDAASCAIGSTVRSPVPVSPEEQQPVGVKPIAGLIAAVGEVFARPALAGAESERMPPRLLVVGGGPSGIELAGNLRARGTEVTLVVRGDRLAPRMPEGVGERSLRSLLRNGVDVRFNNPVRAIESGGVALSGGERISADRVFLATGLSISELFEVSQLPSADDGSLLVDEHLRVANAPIFAAGDCAVNESYNAQRAGVHAVRQGPIIRDNLLATLAGSTGSFRRYEPPANPLQIVNLGDGTAICVKGSRVVHGRWCMGLKFRIDWAFVRSQGRRIIPTILAPPQHRR